MNQSDRDTPWDEQARIYRLLGDRFVELGWATSVLTHDDGIKVDWTPIGKMKIATLHGLMKELGYRSFTSEHLISFIAFLNLEGGIGKK